VNSTAYKSAQPGHGLAAIANALDGVGRETMDPMATIQERLDA
jgi:hypothetical protein